MKTTNIKRSMAGVKTRKGLGALALIVGAASLLPATGANAHGYISSPKSRVIMCKENGIESPSHPAYRFTNQVKLIRYGFLPTVSGCLHVLANKLSIAFGNVIG